ncbi:MAG TPA: UbiH/UbiF family hydroxylase [Burkholderiales bacterium]|nr:UbiH/UbiF family hydroxylase [Burkholderiales bacterium]
MHSFDAIVVGAGIVGAALALALRDADLTVAVIEPAPPRVPDHAGGWDSRVYTVSPGNVSWLEGLGVWGTLSSERLTRVEAMEVFGDRGGSRLDFSAYEAGMRELAWVAESRELQSALWQALEAAPHVTLYCGARCTDIAWERDAARLHLDDGGELAGRLVVGADGSDSWVRERAGIAVKTHQYRQLGVVANFEAERPHRGVAYQWFTGDSVLALLPLPDRLVSMVWSAPEARARELLAMPAEALTAEVERASADAIGRLKVITPSAAFPLKRQHVARLVEPRVALIGDAAHNIHPLAGQGVNLGLRDAREFGRVLAGRGPRRDCGDHTLLRRYERARREDIAALELTTDGLEKLFNGPAVWLAGLRNLGLTLVDAQSPLKTALARRAAA